MLQCSLCKRSSPCRAVAGAAKRWPVEKLRHHTGIIPRHRTHVHLDLDPCNNCTGIPLRTKLWLDPRGVVRLFNRLAQTLAPAVQIGGFAFPLPLSAAEFEVTIPMHPKAASAYYVKGAIGGLGAVELLVDTGSSWPDHHAP